MPVGGPAFSSVRKARAVLKEHAEENYRLLLSIIKQAAASGDYETAAKYTAWLIEHTPEEEGERMVEISIDKPKQVESGPVNTGIQIGVMIGGIKPSLPAAVEVISIEPTTTPTTDTPTDGSAS